MVKAKIHTFKQPSQDEAADLVRRAQVAWLQSGEAELPTAESSFKMYGGLGYVVLHGTDAVLALYRVRSDNLMLRRMKRWPAAVAQ